MTLPKQRGLVRNVTAGFLTMLCAFGSVPAISQPDLPSSKESLKRFGGELQLHISFSLLEDARIRQTSGQYRMKSKRHIAAAAGLDNSFPVDDDRISFSYGLGVVLTHHNYFLLIPGADLPAYPGTGGAPQIQDKSIYFRLSLPLQLRVSLGQTANRSLVAFTGGAVNYSGFSSDVSTSFRIATANGQSPVQLGQAITKSNGRGRPWLSFIVGLSKSILQNRRNRFALEVKAEWTQTDFLRTDYSITVPGKPVSEGNVVVRGGSIGIGLRYFFAKAVPVVKELN